MDDWPIFLRSLEGLLESIKGRVNDTISVGGH